MRDLNWYSFLKKASIKAIENYENGEIYWSLIDFSSETLESQWLGFSKASEEKITFTEARLGNAHSTWNGWNTLIKIKMSQQTLA